jgi:hypothetical protein
MSVEKYTDVCLMIGAGGHGSGSIKLDPHTFYHILISLADDGGDTENNIYWQRALQKLSPDFNGSVKPEKAPVSLGDDKQMYSRWILEYLNKKYKGRHTPQQIESIICNIQNVLDFRLKYNEKEQNFDNIHQALAKMWQQFSILEAQFPALGKYRTDFIRCTQAFLETRIEVFGENNQHTFNEASPLHALNKASFMNILLQTIRNCCNSTLEYKSEMKALGFVPENVEIHYLLDRQLTLQGICQDGTMLCCEKQFDEVSQPNPVSLDSYKLFFKEENHEKIQLDFQNLRRYNPELIKVLNQIKENKNAYIFIPPGSLSNLMAVLNILQEYIVEAKLPIIRVLNAFIHFSEATLQDQAMDFYERFNKQLLVLIGTKENPESFLRESRLYSLLAEYEKEFKIPADQEGVKKYILDNKLNKTLFCLFCLHMEEKIGLKYNPDEIKELVEQVLDIVRNYEVDELSSEFAQIKANRELDLSEFTETQTKNLRENYKLAMH